MHVCLGWTALPLRESIFVHLTSEWAQRCKSCLGRTALCSCQHLMGPFPPLEPDAVSLRCCCNAGSAESNNAAFFRLTTCNTAGAVEK